MAWSLFSSLNRNAVVALLAAAAGLPCALAADVDASPPFLRQALAKATLSGEGQLRFFRLRIYDAKLWVAQPFDAQSYERQPAALELTYHRAFTDAVIAQRSITEIQRQRMLPPAQAERWRQVLAAVMPDVQVGDRLTCLYQPDRGMRLWHGNQELSVIQDAELAQLFMGFWLSPRTSEPDLRRALLGQTTQGTP